MTGAGAAPVASGASLAVAAIFLANGAGFGSWVPHIPTVQARLGVGPGTLGLALLGMAAGALVGIPLAGAAVARLGSRRVLTLAAVVFFVALPLPLLAPDLMTLVAALVVLGAGNGAMDVSMNAQAATVERQLARPVMSAFHGMWSIGGLVGAGSAGLVLALGATPLAHVFAAAASLGAVAGVSLARLLPDPAEATGGRPWVARPTGALGVLGLMALLALVAEGAMGDWSAIYLRHSLATGPALAAAGFAIFSLAMAAGRFAGDRLVARLGNVAVVRASASVGALGLGLALVVARPAAALVGCACVGFGLANLIPILFRAAARVPGVSPGHGLAAVATAGYCGFLAGPPAIGLTAEVLSLPGALGIVVAALVAIAAGARRVDPA